MTATGVRIARRAPSAARTRAAVLVDAYERHHQALYRYCRSIVHHEQDAQDALQSTLARAFAALPDEPHAVELRPWLYRIAHNEAVSILRRRRVTVQLDESLGHAGAVEDPVDARETLRVLQRDIADLPERQRAALILRELNGLGHAEIARVLETTPAAVKQAIFDARRTLSHCRDGRELACREVQRVLSDGDGRRLRSRGVRAHLRTCAACTDFQTDLARRPAALAALAPPLAPGAAAAILAAFQGTAGTTAGAWLTATASGLPAKAFIGLTLAAGGVTAVESTHHHPQPTTRAAASVQGQPARAQRSPAKPPERLAAAGGGTFRSVSVPRRRSDAAIRQPAKDAAPATAAVPVGDTTTATATPPGHAGEQAMKAVPPGQAKEDDGNASKTVPPGQAKEDDGNASNTVPPGQAKKDDGNASKTVPPGQVKKNDGHASKTVPPGQAKKDATPPARAKAKAEKGEHATGGRPPQAGSEGTPPAHGKARSPAAGAAEPAATPAPPATPDETPAGSAAPDQPATDTIPPGRAKNGATPPG